MTNEERKYAEMLDAMDEAVHVIDRDLRILFQNRVMREWHRVHHLGGGVIGRHLCDAYPFLTDGVKDEYRQVFETGKILTTRETSVIDGGEVPTETKKIPIFAGKQVSRVLTCMRDLSAEARSKARLEESEGKYRALVESTDDSIYLVDRQCRYLFMNRRHMARMGFTGDDVLGLAYADCHSPEESRWLQEKIALVFETGSSMRQQRRSQRDGNHFLLTLSPIKQEDGSISAVTVISKDVTQLKNLEEELRTLSLTDALTGLYNRRGFFTLARHQLSLADRRREGMYMLYADLDGLKTINDTCGHQEGDRALVETARLLRATYRSSDVISRIGGDEFAVVPVGSARDDADAIVGRFQRNLDEFNAQGRLPYTLSASVGIVMYDPLHPLLLGELISEADAMMYRQKRLKRDAV